MARKAIKLVKMFNPDNGRVADVHPDEVEHWRKAGWRLVNGD